MQEKPDKFQAVAVGKKAYAKELVCYISCDEVDKLLRY